ncbi:hypothetical protein [Actinomadura rugatobispora]|uniref:Uncharacterized protein n=1 Tax=Actinomadura rugatobispora TaxID=1994 RepID=A0ABW0ZVA8_9ACTN
MRRAGPAGRRGRAAGLEHPQRIRGRSARLLPAAQVLEDIADQLRRAVRASLE